MGWDPVQEHPSLSNIFDTVVIGTFLSVTTCESLIHKMGRKSPQTTKEVINIPMNQTSSEEVVREIFMRVVENKCKGKQDDKAGKGPSDHPNNNKKEILTSGSLVVVGDTKGAKASTTSRRSGTDHARTTRTC